MAYIELSLIKLIVVLTPGLVAYSFFSAPCRHSRITSCASSAHVVVVFLIFNGTIVSFVCSSLSTGGTIDRTSTVAVKLADSKSEGCGSVAHWTVWSIQWTKVWLDQSAID